jgi:hypothetical protein
MRRLMRLGVQPSLIARLVSRPTHQVHPFEIFCADVPGNPPDGDSSQKAGKKNVPAYRRVCVCESAVPSNHGKRPGTQRQKMKREPKEWKELGQKAPRAEGVERTVTSQRTDRLDRYPRYVAPARARKKFEEVKALLTYETILGRPIVREWQRGHLRRLYWPDRSYLYVDSTGEVRTSGGAAARAKFKHALR